MGKKKGHGDFKVSVPDEVADVADYQKSVKKIAEKGKKENFGYGYA